jgi:hypothetical protein
LQYWDIKVGTGAEAHSGQHVKVDYTGWLTNGKKFDSSVGTGKPFEFLIGASQVIKGWDEGVAGMKVGGKRQLRIPGKSGLWQGGVSGIDPAGCNLDFRCDAGECALALSLTLLDYALTTLPLRRQDVQTRMRLVAAPTLACTGRRLTFQRRLVTLWAWLMLFPNCGPLPQISQTRAITRESFQT